MKKLFGICVVFVIIHMFSVTCLADTRLEFVNLANNNSINSFQDFTVEWFKPSGTVQHYVISVRQLSNGKTVTDNLFINKVTVSANQTSYTIPWSMLSNGSTYRISVSAVMSDGSTIWSKSTYFYTTTYKVVTGRPVSFYLYSGFSTAEKNAMYYAAQTWNNVYNLGYEPVNTYSFDQCHNSTTFNTSDGKNRITSATPGVNDTYLMRTITSKNSVGRLTEADININKRDFAWSVGAQSNCYDIQGVMVHEMGHAIGLAHSYQSDATTWTMYYEANKNDISARSLEVGDEVLFGSIYL